MTIWSGSQPPIAWKMALCSESSGRMRAPERARRRHDRVARADERLLVGERDRPPRGDRRIGRREARRCRRSRRRRDRPRAAPLRRPPRVRRRFRSLAPRRQPSSRHSPRDRRSPRTRAFNAMAVRAKRRAVAAARHGARPRNGRARAAITCAQERPIEPVAPRMTSLLAGRGFWPGRQRFQPDRDFRIRLQFSPLENAGRNIADPISRRADQSHEKPAAINPSSRSMRPPWPGIRWLESLTPNRRFNADSKRSPPCATAAVARPRTKQRQRRSRRRRRQQTRRRAANYADAEIPTRFSPARRAAISLGPPIKPAAEIGHDVGAPDHGEQPNYRVKPVRPTGAQQTDARPASRRHKARRRPAAGECAAAPRSSAKRRPRPPARRRQAQRTSSLVASGAATTSPAAAEQHAQFVIGAADQILPFPMDRPERRSSQKALNQ